MPEKVLTLCIIHQHPKVLLGMKKRGFGAGKWNGFGGKVMEGESVEEAVRREVKEEIGVSIFDLEKAGELNFEFHGNPEKLKVHVFRAGDFQGQPMESEEMKPEWFFIDQIPFKEMWPDDVYWMPLFFAGKNFIGHFSFADENTLIDRKIELVP